MNSPARALRLCDMRAHSSISFLRPSMEWRSCRVRKASCKNRASASKAKVRLSACSLSQIVIGALVPGSAMFLNNFYLVHSGPLLLSHGFKSCFPKMLLRSHLLGPPRLPKCEALAAHSPFECLLALSLEPQSLLLTQLSVPLAELGQGLDF